MTGPEPGQRPRSRRPDLQNLFDSLKPSEPLRAKSITNSLSDQFVLIPSGSFVMGTSELDPLTRSNEQPQHEIVLTKPFYLGIHPVTQRSYQAVTGKNPSKFTLNDGGGWEHPVERVSWQDAELYCQRLSDQKIERELGHTYRLPTEAEWEYACRGNTTTPFSHGPELTKQHALFWSPDAKTSPVGAFPANFFGLYDMHGNVWEWCQDWYQEDYYLSSPLRDPTGPETGILKVQRGGSWKNQSERCRAAYRNALAPHQKNSSTGFRVVLEIRIG